MTFALTLFGRQIEFRTKALPALHGLSPSGNGWWPWIHEPFLGAWQRNVDVRADTALSYYAVYACARLVATDIAKTCLYLVEEDDNYIWNRTESPAFSPVLRKPNRYQTINKFIESWLLSKLLNGNTYVLARRDGRGLVNEMHVLDPQRVKPLVTQAGDVYYELKRDDLSRQALETVIVPASEIGHDTYITPFHPLIGLSPIFAASLSITEGLSILNNSKNFFTNGANPSGMLTAPGAISDATAARLLATIAAKNPGDTLVGGDGLKYEQFTMSAVDAQLIEQLKMSAEQVCSAYGVPPYLVDIGPPPPYANFEPILLKYHSQCIQSLMTNFEGTLEKLLGLNDKIDGRQLGTEFNIDDLIWMDTVTRVTSAKTAIEGGGMSPDEARFKYHALGPTPGGKSVMAQQQNYSLAALAQRDANDPFAKPAPAPTAPPNTPDTTAEDDAQLVNSFGALLHQKSVEAGLYAA